MLANLLLRTLADARRVGAPLWLGCAAALIALPAGCTRAEQTAHPSLERLERLAFVPPRSGWLYPTQPRVDISNGRALLVERFEVERGDWLDWLEANPGAAQDPPGPDTCRLRHGGARAFSGHQLLAFPYT